MNEKLFLHAILKFFCGVALVGILLFLPAGALAYWNGWLLMAILFVPMFLAGIVLMFKNPELLSKRLNAKEKQAEQGNVIAWSALMFLGGFVSAGLGHRFGWLVLPSWVSIVAAVLFLLAYLMYAEVLRENTYLSRTIEIQKNQKVVDTGLYRIVRHPMYSATLLLFFSIPFVLGSGISVLFFLAYPAIIAKRIRHEEATLAEGLKGYADYMERVKYRLIPFIW